MRKTIISVMVIAIVAILISLGTMATFSDTEKSSNNSFNAGSISLNWWIDWHLGNPPLDGQDVAMFNYEDIKPGYNEKHLLTYFSMGMNPGNLALDVKNVIDAENGIMEPEAEAGDVTDPDGELAERLQVFMWNDTNFNCVYEGEPVLYNGPVANMPPTIALGILPVWSWYDIGIEVSLPAGTGNEVMTDSTGFDLDGTLSQI